MTSATFVDHEQVSTNLASDRRAQKRFRFSLPLSIRTGDGAVIRAITLEISPRGLSAVLASPLQLGEKVQLEPVAEGEITAQVCHNVGKVYGFEFLHVSEAQAVKLTDLCSRLPLYPPNKMSI